MEVEQPRQTTNSVLMIRPASFGFNDQTSGSNNYQKNVSQDAANINAMACNEFDLFVEKLRKVGVDVHVFQDDDQTIKPDALFPNNWLRVEHSGAIELFPMLAENRRLERNPQVILELEKNFQIKSPAMDWSTFEKDEKYLEGTGSVVFDHPRRRAFACLSPRTDQELFVEYCQSIQYEPNSFVAQRSDGQLQYHTNVILSIGQNIALGDFGRISKTPEGKNAMDKLASSHELIELAPHQVEESFSGNCLQLHDKNEEPVWVFSERAWQGLTVEQQSSVHGDGTVVKAPLHIVETVGGGSARCMICEIFAPALEI